MLKKLLAIVLTLLTVLPLSACRQDEPVASQNAFYRFTDSTGQRVTLAQKPQRVAVLLSSFADIWVSAGGQVSITVGEAVERGFADGDATLVDGGAGKTIDTEALLAAEPDFVICSADLEAQVEAAELLRQAGIPCAAFHVENFPDYLDMLKICTDITETPDAYQQYGVQVQEKIDQILSQIPAQEPGQEPRILFIRSGSGASSAKAKIADQHFAASMLEELGAINIAQEAPVLLDGLSVEAVMEQNPDQIFIATMGDEQAAKAYMDMVLQSDAWRFLSAVQQGRCTYLPKELFQFKPNARWDEAYRYLAQLLYPEISFS